MIKVLLSALILTASLSLFGLEKFDPNEKCGDLKGQVIAAKDAAVKACKWITDLGSGTKTDKEKAFYKISQSRFCDTGYVWIQNYYDHETMAKDKYKDQTAMLLHPVKPASEGIKGFFHKDFAGYHVFEQTNVASYKILKAKKPEYKEGCWITYKWTAPDSDKIVDKVSYVTTCFDKVAKIQVSAGSGVYASLKDLPAEEQKAICDEGPNPYNFK